MRRRRASSSMTRTGPRRKSDYLPSADDGDFIASLMAPITEPGKFATGFRRQRSASTTSPAISNT